MSGLRAYNAQASDQIIISERVRSHMPLARKLAWQVHGRARDLFDIEDMIQMAMLALVEAAQRFEDRGEATFGSYAMMRIRGTLIDHVRNNLSLSRNAVQRRDKIAAAEKEIIAEGGDAKDPKLVAAKLGITATELVTWRNQISVAPDKSLDEVYDDHSAWFADQGHTPESALQADDLKSRLMANLKRLKERDAMVLQLYYVEELNLEEIAEVLDVTVGRVSQLKKAALAQLREWLQDD
ncbi:MAG: sigma-70 family RNA polymerase sigma factor [Beijerinckiaceae bacterium]|nr:sigma-70 family RNA polymerase sigma factor [Beijerinckiaceae bacterium]